MRFLTTPSSAVELEIVGSNGVKTLKGGKIRSALRLKEQLFVINKHYNGSQVAVHLHGPRLGARRGDVPVRGLRARQKGVKYDQIVKHYYTGVELTKMY